MGAKTTLFVGVAIIIIMGIIFIALTGAYVWKIFEGRSRSSCPENGTYYCQTLNATIFIVDRKIQYQTNNGLLMNAIILYGGTITEEGDFNYGLRARFQWEQDTDVIKLKFEEYPEKIDQKKTYKFVKQD